MSYLYDTANEAWEAAACHGHEAPDLWFPPRGHGNAGEPAVREAVAICNGCVLRRPCLAHALHNNEQGIWGGLTERQRHELVRDYAANQIRGVAS